MNIYEDNRLTRWGQRRLHSAFEESGGSQTWTVPIIAGEIAGAVTPYDWNRGRRNIEGPIQAGDEVLRHRVQLWWHEQWTNENTQYAVRLLTPEERAIAEEMVIAMETMRPMGFLNVAGELRDHPDARGVRDRRHRLDPVRDEGRRHHGRSSDQRLDRAPCRTLGDQRRPGCGRRRRRHGALGATRSVRPRRSRSARLLARRQVCLRRSGDPTNARLLTLHRRRRNAGPRRFRDRPGRHLRERPRLDADASRQLRHPHPRSRATPP